MSDDWPKIQVEREACGDLFESLTPEQWASPSWCEGWNVLEVAGHLLAATPMPSGAARVTLPASLPRCGPGRCGETIPRGR